MLREHNVIRVKNIAKRNKIKCIANEDCCVFGFDTKNLKENEKNFQIIKSSIDTGSFAIRNYMMTALLGMGGAEDDFLDNYSGLIDIRFCIDKYDLMESVVIISDAFSDLLTKRYDLIDVFDILDIELSDTTDDEEAINVIERISTVDLVYLYYSVVKEHLNEG